MFRAPDLGLRVVDVDVEPMSARGFAAGGRADVKARAILAPPGRAWVLASALTQARGGRRRIRRGTRGRRIGSAHGICKTARHVAMNVETIWHSPKPGQGIRCRGNSQIMLEMRAG